MLFLVHMHKKNALSFSDQQGVVSCFLLGGLLMFEPQNNLVRAESVLPSCGQKPPQILLEDLRLALCLG